MEVLMIVLLMISVTVAMAAAGVGCSYALGAFYYKREATEQGQVDPACDRCHADAEWYGALPAWKQTAIAGWWWANRLACAARNCG